VHFSSAVVLGDGYHYDEGQGITMMPKEIRSWPWSTIQLVTFALPIVGDMQFRDALDGILSSKRIFLTGDFITQERINYPVGTPVEIDPDSFEMTEVEKREVGGPVFYGYRMSSYSPLRHEPYNIRKYYIKYLERQRAKRGLLPPGPPFGPPDEPWKVFKNLQVLIESLLRAGPNTGVDQILGPNFSARLLKYLDICESITSDPDKKPLIRDLSERIGEIRETESNRIHEFLSIGEIRLWFLYENFENKFDSNLAKFFGLCLFLSLASKMTYSDTLALSKRKPKGMRLE
jgi:hypothetical protein